MQASALAAGGWTTAQLMRSSDALAEPLGAAEPTHPATNFAVRTSYPSLAPLGKEVFTARIERARAIMRTARADALVATSGSTNFSYLVGSSFGRSERLIALVLPADGAPVLIAPSFETERVRRGARIGEVHGWEEAQDPFTFVRAALGSARSILVEPRTDYWVSARIQRTVPDARLVDGSDAFETLRVVKSAEEIQRMRHAIAITEDAIAATFDQLRVGMRDTDVARVLAAEHTKRGIEGGGLVQFGPQSALPHGGTTSATLEPNTVVLIDAGGEYQGYASDITRTRWFGERVPAKLREIYDVVHDAQSAAMARVKPGVACQEIDRAARAVITKAGYGNYFTHRLGHGMGMDEHEPAYMVEGNTRPLEPGFVFSVEPGIYLPNEFGVRIEDDFTCTASGGELLSRRAPKMS
ncbi:MAG TPA: Xaa-Pro peptidase family protein [Gemmatimonadaceae bacterium]|nr:Xaa-Pro peptidase family protein [Gemmatimonadaceae bacterium]